MLRHYAKIAWRTVRRHPVTSLIHVLGLTLGILSCLVIFLVTRYELGFDRDRPDRDRIYRVTTALQSHLGETHWTPSIPDPSTPVMRSELTGLEAVAFCHTWNPGVKIPGKKIKTFEPRKNGDEAMDIVIADPDYFSVFPAEWVVGNPQTAMTEPFRVVLTESQARRYFGDIPPASVLGREVIYEDSLHVFVSGIVKDPVGQTDLDFRDFITYATVDHSFIADELNLNNWGMWGSSSGVFIKLAPGTPVSRVQRQLTDFGNRHFHMVLGDKAFTHLQPLSDLHFNGTYHDPYSRQAHLPTLYGLMGIALFILVIACINFINLSTAQSIQRAKEIGVRKVLGSGKGRLVVQFLSETVLLASLAAVLSLALLQPALNALQWLLPRGITLHLVRSGVLVFLAVTVLFTALGAGYYPARVLSSFLPATSLKGKGSTRLNRRSLLRRVLIVFQFTISLVFIIGTLIVGRQIGYMLHTDLGFQPDAVLNIPTSRHYPNEQRDYLATLINRIPGVSMVSRNGGTPAATGHNGTSFTYRGRQSVEIHGELLLADSAYIPLFQLRLISGRNLRSSDTMQEFVINETAARALGFRNPADAVGQMVEAGMTDANGLKALPVAGVVADFHSRSLHSAIQPDFIVSSIDNSHTLSVKLDAHGDIPGIVRRIGNAYALAYPGEKFTYSFFDEDIARFYTAEQKTARIIGLAMGIAIFISCMGLFGLAAFTAQQRTKEVGIRKVMGATVSRIVVLLCRDFVYLVGLSILVASPLAWWGMRRWLQDYPYRVSIDAWIFVAAGAGAVFIALATVSIHAIRVARANPVDSLRTE
jgi:predicted permease